MLIIGVNILNLELSWINSAKLTWNGLCLWMDYVMKWIMFVAPWCSGYDYCSTSFNKVWTLGSAQVQILLTACRRFTMVSIPDNVLAGNNAKRLSSVNHTTKTIHHHRHHHYRPLFKWPSTCARKPKVPGSSPAACYEQRWALCSNQR